MGPEVHGAPRRLAVSPIVSRFTPAAIARAMVRSWSAGSAWYLARQSWIVGIRRLVDLHCSEPAIGDHRQLAMAVEQVVDRGNGAIGRSLAGSPRSVDNPLPCLWFAAALDVWRRHRVRRSDRLVANHGRCGGVPVPRGQPPKWWDVGLTTAPRCLRWQK